MCLSIRSLGALPLPQLVSSIVRLLRRSLVVSSAALALGGCDDPAGPQLSEPIALVRMRGRVELDRTHQLLVLGLQSRHALTWTPSVMFRIVRTTPAPDGRFLYVRGYGPAGWKEAHIAVLDIRTLAVQRREFFADSAGYRVERFGGLAIDGSGEIVVSPDGTKLFAAGAQHAESRAWGVAVLDEQTLGVLGFIPLSPDHNASVAVIPPGAFHPSGAVAASAPESRWPNVGSQIRFVDPATLAVFDSVDLSSSLGGRGDGILDMAAAPDGSSLYLQTAEGQLIKYDLLARAVTARAMGGFFGRMTVSPNGSRVYFVRSWSHDAPSPGVVAVYDADLSPLPPIDLSGVEVSPFTGRKSPPALKMAAVAPDGMLLVASGAAGTQLWGSQPGRIFFVDPASHRIVSTVAVDDVAPHEVVIP